MVSVKDKIVSIEEGDIADTKFEGYKIVTESGLEVIIGVGKYSKCCEEWGYLSSNDNYKDFIGATLLGVEVVSPDLETSTVWQKETLEHLESDAFEESAAAVFVNVNTDKGLFQLAVYNAHNGYYEHHVLVRVGKKVLEDGYI